VKEAGLLCINIKYNTQILHTQSKSVSNYINKNKEKINKNTFTETSGRERLGYIEKYQGIAKGVPWLDYTTANRVYVACAHLCWEKYNNQIITHHS
jgi:hypothetical protein